MFLDNWWTNLMARVFNRRFSLELPELTPGDEWFLDWVLRSPQSASVHLTAGWHAYSAVALEVDGIESAVEFFGGIGAQSLAIQDLFHPKRHVVQDYSEAAVRHLRAHLPDNIWSRRANSYLPASFIDADLVGLDFGDLTAYRTRPGERIRELLDRVFAFEPKAVVLTDVACRYLHLHRELYETFLGPGTCVSYESYLYAFLGRLSRLYGYHLLVGYMHTWSTVMALVPYPVAGARLLPTPNEPKGIELGLAQL
jgi:hypothetical protein